jgi:hypothetical protein
LSAGRTQFVGPGRFANGLSKHVTAGCSFVKRWQSKSQAAES